MPQLDPEYLETAEQAQRRHRSRPTTAGRRAGTETPAPRAPSAPDGELEPVRREGAGAMLWPALTSFALVFAAGVYGFWLLHPGQQPPRVAPPRGVVLPSFVLVAGWVTALVLLPRLLPRALAWVMLAAGTVLAAIVLSREVTAWLQAVLGQIPL